MAGDVGKWTEKYILTEDTEKLFARDERGNKYYAKNDAGDEIYPVVKKFQTPFMVWKDFYQCAVYAKNRFGDEYYPKDTRYGSEILYDDFAQDRHGKLFYPKWSNGDEYFEHAYILRDGDTYLNDINSTQTLSEHAVVVYPLDATGLPVLDQYYYNLDGRYPLPTDRQGNSVYLRRQNQDGHLNEVYPPDQSCAFLKDGVTPKYARNFLNEAIFPTRRNGEEFYFQHGRTRDDFTGGLHRYARGRYGEKYPRKKNSNGTYEALIGNRYARNVENREHYPLDVYGNEYYLAWNSLFLTEKDVLLDRYAVSETGFYILPEKGDQMYISETIRPRIRRDQATGEKMDRGFDDPRDYLTRVSSGITAHGWRHWREKYIGTRDERTTFARNVWDDPYYARNSQGDEVYPVVNDEPVFLMDPILGTRRYARDSEGNEMYYEYPESMNKAPAVLQQQYALKSNGEEYYPRRPDGREIVLGNRYARGMGRWSAFYPKDENGNEYHVENLSYIMKQETLIYPRTQEGRPIYPTVTLQGMTIENYVEMDEKYHIGTDRKGNAVYARVVDDKGHWREKYPPDLSYAYLRTGEIPMYARDDRGEVIFPVDENGEHYLKYATNLDDATNEIRRYARHLGREIYPQKFWKIGSTVRMYEIILNNQYAKDEAGFRYYPLDCFGNEYYLPWNVKWEEQDVEWEEQDVLLENTYALSITGHYIVPKKDMEPYISATARPTIQRRNIVGISCHGCPFPISHFLTDVSSGTVPRKMSPYRYPNENDPMSPPQPSPNENDPVSPPQPSPNPVSPPQPSPNPVSPPQPSPNPVSPPQPSRNPVPRPAEGCDDSKRNNTPFYQLWYFWTLLTSIILILGVTFLVWTDKISLKSLLDLIFWKSS